MLLIDCRAGGVRHRAGRRSRHIPMGDILAHVNEIDAAEAHHVIVDCHHGVRSLQVASVLRKAGIETARSMAGGIERWSMEIDASVPRY